MPRSDGRQFEEMRPVKITLDYLPYAEGSVLIEMGNTKVICTATCEDKVPAWKKGSGTGWITAEYAMLPRSSQQRVPRESSKGKVGGRTHEIQRLIGRSLRSVIDMEKLPEMTIWIDCDVISADGGTRCASITGAYVALADALRKLEDKGKVPAGLLRDSVAAISLGIVGGALHLDLNYIEDSSADVDMNLVMTGSGKFIEIQGTAEKEPFDGEMLSKMLAAGSSAINDLIKIQDLIILKDVSDQTN